MQTLGVKSFLLASTVRCKKVIIKVVIIINFI